ncbi:hypothetical protein D3C71_1833820 [compost metagenome]
MGKQLPVKTLVDLDVVEQPIIQGGQGRLAGAEIIQPQRKQFAQPEDLWIVFAGRKIRKTLTDFESNKWPLPDTVTELAVSENQIDQGFFNIKRQQNVVFDKPGGILFCQFQLLIK